MERYLKSPLSSEPAPASIVRKDTIHNRMDSAAISHHSLYNYSDVKPHGRNTSFQPGKPQETFDDWFTEPPQAGPIHLMDHVHIVERLGSNLPDLQCAETPSPGRLKTSKTVGPVDMAKDWAERMEKAIPQYLPDREIDYRAKAAEEIAKIQEKAKELEQLMLQYRAERVCFEGATASVTTEAAYAQMAANPKLAWILGGDPTDVSTISRPKSASGRIDRLPQDMDTSSTAFFNSQEGSLRKSTSGGTLDDGDRQFADSRDYGRAFECYSNRRIRYYCTFCQKRFYNRVEWMRHEQNVHMPGELWVCCKYQRGIGRDTCTNLSMDHRPSDRSIPQAMPILRA